MKPLSTGALAGLLFAGALIQGTSAAVYLKGVIEFDGGTTAGSSCPSAAKTGSISFAVVQAACTDALTCASGVGQVCATDTDFQSKIASTMGSLPYVTISTFSDTTCTAANIQTSAVYAADGSCHLHPTTSGSFKVVTVPADTTTIATIKSYSTADCTTTATDLAVTSTLLSTTGGCDAGTSTQYKASWVTAVKAASSFDGSDCTNRANLISLSSGTCTEATCSNGAKVICTTNLKYESAISTAYGTTPYVTVSTYSDAACTWSKLSSATVYTADGKCRVITSGSKYYKVIFSTGTDDVTIKFFTDSTCTAAIADSDIPIAKATFTTCVTATKTKYTYSSSNWPTAKKAITTYDSSDCGTLGSVSVGAGPCTNSNNADVDCTSGAGEFCTSNINYDLTIADKYPITGPSYLSIATYTGSDCVWSNFDSAKVYFADTKCHKYGTDQFYKLSPVPLGGGSEPKIMLYTDDACAKADTSTISTANIQVTRTNLYNGCSGTTFNKVSANWPKAMSVVGLGAYTVPASGACVGGTPSRLTLTDVSATGNACGTTRGCASATALTDCTTVTDYKNYLKTAFGSVPYLVKETYSASGCSTLSSVVAWAADGTCYVDDKNSFKVVATSSGVSIKSWKGDDKCTTSTTVTPTDTPVATSSLLTNACVSGTTKYYMGGSWVFASNAAYDDSKCALTPSKLSFSLAPTCTVPTGDAACASTTPTTPENAKTGYNAPGCSKMTSADYFSAIDKAFGMTTYVVQESYTACTGGSLTGVTAYVADGACHLSGDAASSYKVTYDPSATATAAAVKIEAFSSQDCTTGAATAVTVTPAALTAHTCDATLFTKTYVGGLATQLTAVTIYSDKTCTLPVQTVFTGTANTCTAAACTTSGTVFTKTACTSAKSDYNATLAAIYGSARRLVSDIYEAKDTNKCGTRQGIVAYVGDSVCHTALDQSSFTAAPGSSNTATDATLTTYTDKNCTKEPKALTIAAANLATATTAPCDGTNSIKWSIGGTEPATEAPATAAPTPAPTTAVSTGSGKSAAVSSFSVSIFGLLASIIGGLAVLLN